MEPRLVTGCQDFVFDCPPPPLYTCVFQLLATYVPFLFFSPLAYSPCALCLWAPSHLQMEKAGGGLILAHHAYLFISGVS